MFLPVLAGLAEERQQVLEQQFRAFLRDPVTAPMRTPVVKRVY
jgi:hypothetical protein